MRDVTLEPGKAKEVSDEKLEEVLASGYGIFSGTRVQWAELRFSSSVARYVSLEDWHSKQRSRWEKDGSYVLEVPFSSDKELAMDILRYGADVEVVSPKSLREEIGARLKAAASRY
jgi:predicted DNA-binding transcriptional regulator YafY